MPIPNGLPQRRFSITGILKVNVSTFIKHPLANIKMTILSSTYQWRSVTTRKVWVSSLLEQPLNDSFMALANSLH